MFTRHAAPGEASRVVNHLNGQPSATRAPVRRPTLTEQYTPKRLPVIEGTMEQRSVMPPIDRPHRRKNIRDLIR